MTDTDIDVFN